MYWLTTVSHAVNADGALLVDNRQGWHPLVHLNAAPYQQVAGQT